MRKIGRVETELDAKIFADYLYVRNVVSEVEQISDSAWDIWVFNEEHVDLAKALFSRFLSMPSSVEFADAVTEAAQRRKGEEKAEKKIEKKLERAAPLEAGKPQLTFLLILFSTIATIWTQFGEDKTIAQWLYFNWSLICDGQVWRLVTPVFLHFNPMHLIFNLLWIFDLGRGIEARIGTLRFLALVLVLAVASNAAQFYMGGAAFGGLSGVVYGLAAYLWVRGRYDRHYEGLISGMTAVFLLIWLAMGLFGMVGAVANTAHFSGLLVGACAGWLVTRLKT